MEEEPQAMEASPLPSNLPSSTILPPRSSPTMVVASPSLSSPLMTAVNRRPTPAHAPAPATLAPGPGYSTRIPSPSSRFASAVTASSSSGSPTAPATFPARSELRRLPCQIWIFATLLHATGHTMECNISALTSETHRDTLNTNLALMGVAPLGLGAWMPCSMHPSPLPDVARGHCPVDPQTYGQGSVIPLLGLLPLLRQSPSNSNAPAPDSLHLG